MRIAEWGPSDLLRRIISGKKQLLERVMRERAVTVPDLLKARDLRDHVALAAKLRTAIDEPISAGLWRAWHEAVFEHPDIAQVHAEWRKDVLEQLAHLIGDARAAAGSPTGTLDAGVVAWTLLTLYRELAIHDRPGAPDIDELARFSQALIFGLAVGPHLMERRAKRAAT